MFPWTNRVEGVNVGIILAALNETNRVEIVGNWQRKVILGEMRFMDATNYIIGVKIFGEKVFGYGEYYFRIMSPLPEIHCP